MINELYYLNKALKMAENDLANLMRKWKIYLPTEENLGRKPTFEDHLKADDLRRSGYDINKEIDKRVKIMGAISDLTSTIYFKNLK